jgi:hypothetical protein
MKKLIPILVFVSFIFIVKGQSGDISGKVKDENAWGVSYTTVVIVDSNAVSTGRGVTTDADGNYSITPLAPGKYNIQYIHKGYISQMIKGVVVSDEKSTFIDVKLKVDPNAPVGKKKKKYGRVQ